MGLKFRRGTTAQKSGSLAFGEPYVNTDLGTLQIGGASGDITLGASGTGSAGIFSTISGSSLDISGNATIHGDLSIGGKIQIGDNTSDTVNVVASLSSSLIPSLDNTFDLGSLDKYWRDLYISTGSIKMVSNGVVISTLSNTGNGMVMDQGLTAKGDSSFGTSSAAITAITGSLKVSGSASVIGELSASTINGIGNVSTFSASVSTSFSASNASVVAVSQSVYDTINWPTTGLSASFSSGSQYQVNVLSQSVYDTLYWPTTGLSASVSSSIGTLSGSVSTSISELSSSVSTSIYNNLYSNVSSLSQSFASASAAYSSSVSESIYQNVWSNASSLSSSIAMAQSTYSSSTYSTFAKLSGDNVFTGTQTITGSLYVSSNLIVQGSSSLQNITASAVSIGTNTVILNTANPSVRFGGVSVIDQGGSGTTGSLLWDSTNNVWIYENPNGGGYGSARLISGPKNSGSLGNEGGLTVGQVSVAVGDDHIGDSIISASATQVYVSGSLKVADSLGFLTVAGNAFSEIYLSSNGAMLLNAGGSGVQIKSNSLAVDNSLTVGTSISSSTITGIGNVTTYSASVASRVNTLETAGYAVSSSVASATAASITSLSSSVKAVTDTFATSASVASATANSISTLSGSIFTTDSTQTNNIATSTAAAAGAFASASAYSASAAVVAITNANSAAGAFASASAYSASLANNTVTFNGSAIKLGGSATITATATNALTIGTGLSGTSYNGSSAITIANTGVTSITGTANQVIASAGTGGVTLSLPQSIATTSAVAFASVTTSGDIVAYSTSDKRHKHNIVNISDALSKVTKLNGVTWEWNDDVDAVTKLSPKTGLIAQEVQEVLPEVVTERENGFLGLDYSKMMGLMVEAIKEQQTQIAELKAEIEALKK